MEKIATVFSTRKIFSKINEKIFRDSFSFKYYLQYAYRTNRKYQKELVTIKGAVIRVINEMLFANMVAKQHNIHKKIIKILGKNSYKFQ